MTQESQAKSGNEPQPAAETGDVHARVQTLRENTIELSETLRSVEETLREASGETKV